MTDEHRGEVGQERRFTILGVLLTVVLGPFILARPPDFSGWPLRTFLLALFGSLIWAAGLYRLYLVVA